PFAIVAGAMQNAEDHDVGLAADEEDAIWKSFGEHPANLWPAPQTWVTKRIFGCSSDRRFDFGDKVVTEIGLLTFVPDRRLGDIHLGLDPDNSAMVWLRHGRSLDWTRALTWSQGAPALGDFSYSAIAASSV